MDAPDSGEEVRLEESDVDVRWDMLADEVGGDSAVGVRLSQLWGGVGGGGKVCGGMLAAGRGVWAICRSWRCWGRTC